ncbi:unnamed protein product [Calypogeia fissa]
MMIVPWRSHGSLFGSKPFARRDPQVYPGYGRIARSRLSFTLQQQQNRVREVIDVMELELGLTPGWLLQRSCKVYLFISSSKKIVGCLMAEPITSAFRVVSAQCQSSRIGVKLNQSDGQYKKPSIMATDLQSTMKESSTQRDRRSHEADKSEPGFIEGESCLLPKSSSGVSSKDAISASNLSFICVSRFEAPTHSPESTSKVKGADPT